MAIKKKKVRKKSGPKLKEIDFEEFDKLCAFQCTAEEIAAWFRVSVDTIERRVKARYGMKFAEYFNEKRELGHISLRRKQFQVALAGSVPLLIFLGKNYLNQTDKKEVSVGNTKENLFKLAYNVGDEPKQIENKKDEDATDK